MTHSHQGKMLFSDSQRGLTNTLSRHKGSCHQNEMRIAVGGPILATVSYFSPGLGGCLETMEWQTKPCGTTFREPYAWGPRFYLLLPVLFFKEDFSKAVVSGEGVLFRLPGKLIYSKVFGRSRRAGQSLVDSRGKGFISHYSALDPDTDGPDLLLPRLRIF